MASWPGLAEDLVLPFRVERTGLRGRFLRLGPLLTEILARHDYPVPVSGLLAELIVLTAALGSALKYDGIFTLQTNGDGPVSILVADMTSAGALRAYAQFDAGRVAALADGPDLSPVPALIGQGHLAFTVDQGQDTERYQGIVALEGSTLTDCIHHYFRQSEQIDAAIKVAVAHDGGAGEGERWRGGAIMVQRLPDVSGAPERGRGEADEDWREVVTLMGSARTDEIVDPALAPDRLLYRLFHEPGVRAFAPLPVSAGCRCSRRRVARTLAAFPREEILALMEDDAVSVRCEFCGADYAFDRGAIEALFAA
ncbi:MAG: molecular chaperone Hsp33 [Alphaproteobacteria bacterium]|nr:molecular chaperone Hsp33 [Alphaproteobacteria bacterium]